MIASSKYLGALPKTLGNMEVYCTEAISELVDKTKFWKPETRFWGLYWGLETLYYHITKTYDLGFSTYALVYRTSSYGSSIIKLSIIIRASTYN